MPTTVHPFLLFQGQAEEAITLYLSLFPHAEVHQLLRYGPNAPGGVEGKVQRASFSIAGQTILATDSVVPHDFAFTPALSLFVSCASADELMQLYSALAEGGSTLMPPDCYGFSRRFAWLNDRFGVSWQLNLS